VTQPSQLHPNSAPPSFEQLRAAITQANSTLLRTLRDLHAVMPAQAKLLSPRSLTDADAAIYANLSDSDIQAIAPHIKPRLVPTIHSLENYLQHDDPGLLLGACMLDARITR